MRRWSPLWILCSVFWLGAGPILVDTEETGDPVPWEDGIARYNPESGEPETGEPETGEGASLGRLSNEEALDLLRELFGEWQSLTLNGYRVADFSFVEGSGLGEVDAGNLDDFFSYCPPDEECPDEDPPFVLGSAGSGQSPFLFDADGEITDLIQGKGAKNSILGFAGPRVVERVDGRQVITEGQTVLNGLFIDCPSDGAAADDPCQDPEVDLEDFKGVVFHEIGHFIGLDHSQVNLGSSLKALQGDLSEIEAIPTMFPLLVDGAAQRTPHFDDIVSLALLYPGPDLSFFCTLEGTVYQADGVTKLQGVNVVARREDNPLLEATSFVSGQLYVGSSANCDNDAGDFRVIGLTPGAAYTLEIEKISRAFTGGSSIEPCDPPQSGFDEEVLPGTFSCSQGGGTITAGTTTSTRIVTTKGQEEAADNPGGGCSLIPLFL